MPDHPIPLPATGLINRSQQEKPVIVLIGGDAATIDRAVSLGYDVFLIQTPRKFNSEAARNAYISLIIDYEHVSNLASFVRAAQQTRTVTAVVSLTEFGLLPAALLNEALGLPGIASAAVRRTRDKFSMRERLAPLSPLPSRLVKTAADAIAFGTSCGWPIILKPNDGVASRRVRRAGTAAQAAQIPWNGETLLAEKFIAGRVLSVEAFSYAGRHVIYGINEEFPVGEDGPPGCNPFVETAHQMPASLQPDQAEEIAALVRQALGLLEVDQGPSHTEVIVSGGTYHVLETHTRVGGDFIPEMLQRCTGIDLLSLPIAALSGAEYPPPAPEAWRHGAALQFFTPPPGRVVRVSGVETCRDIPGIVAIKLDLKPGDVIPALSACDDRAGYVMAVCATAAEAAARCAEVRQAVQIEVDPA